MTSIRSHPDNAAPGNRRSIGPAGRANAVELLGVGAVIGQQVPLDLWAELSDATADELAETIEQASEASIVADWPMVQAGSFDTR